MARPKTRTPKHCHHKATGQGYVTIDGTRNYTGTYGTQTATKRYDALINELHRNLDVDELTCTIGMLLERFKEHGELYYRRPDGTPTGALYNMVRAFGWVMEKHRTTRVADFRSKDLKAIQKAMADSKKTRQQINREITHILGFFTWGVSENLVTAEKLIELRTVPALRRGRSKATEATKIESVDPMLVTQTLELLEGESESAKRVADMIRLQLYTGMRPCEVRLLRVREVDQSGEVWVADLEQHKTSHREKKRFVYIGPKAQAIIGKHLTDRDPDEYVFLSAQRGPNGVKAHTKTGYARYVMRVCRKFNLPSWTPRQLRKTFAENVRDKHSLNAARAALGHSDQQTTAEHYADYDLSIAREVAKDW